MLGKTVTNSSSILIVIGLRISKLLYIFVIPPNSFFMTTVSVVSVTLQNVLIFILKSITARYDLAVFGEYDSVAKYTMKFIKSVKGTGQECAS